MFRTYKDLVRTPLKSRNSSDAFEGYKCEKCDAHRFITETDIEIHKKADHWVEISKEMVDYKERFCTACMILLPSYSELLSHVKSAHLLSSPTAKVVEREIFICHHCHHMFFNKGLMEIHVQYVHVYTSDEQRKSKSSPCPKCKKTISLKSLWFHFQLHEIPSVSACDICLTNFPTKQALYEHLKTHPSIYKCLICNFNTTREELYNAHLADHKKRSYERKRKNMDNFIRRSFRRKIRDNPRFNIHNALKGLYVPNVIDICTICREICTDKVEMKVHILRDHMGRFEEVKKKHMCACGQEFFNKVLLKQHVLKMKGFHRGLEDGEEPETLINEVEGDVGEIVYQIPNNAEKSIHMTETVDDEEDALSINVEVPSSDDNVGLPSDVNVELPSDVNVQLPSESTAEQEPSEVEEILG